MKKEKKSEEKKIYSLSYLEKIIVVIKKLKAINKIIQNKNLMKIKLNKSKPRRFKTKIKIDFILGSLFLVTKAAIVNY